MKVAQSHPALCWPHGLYCPGNSPGQNTGAGSFSLLHGIFPNQGSNPGLPHCRQILYQLSHKESPRILEWVAYPFSSGSLQPRNQTGVSCIAGGFFTNWAIRDEYLLPENKFTHIPSPALQQNQPTGTGSSNSKCLGLQLGGMCFLGHWMQEKNLIWFWSSKFPHINFSQKEKIRI